MGRRLRKTNEFREAIHNTYDLGSFTAEVFFWSQRAGTHLERLLRAPNTPKNRGKLFAAEVVAKETAGWLEDCKRRCFGLERDEVVDRAGRYQTCADAYLKAQAGKPFTLEDHENDKKPPREIVPKPSTVAELRGRGVVYKAAAEDLRDIADRWQYAKWQRETRKRAYDQFGRMVQPAVGKRPRTVKKILTNRPPDMGPYEGGFLDS